MVYKINWFIVIILVISMLCKTMPLVGKQKRCFVIRGVKVYQESGFTDNVDVLVENGVIQQISNNIQSSCKVIEGSGKTLLPGLVNAHVHAWLPYHLKNALNHGVYTLFDMHSLNETTLQLRQVNKEEGYASLYGAGYAATVKGGHGTQFGYEVPVIGGDRSCYDFVDGQVAAGLDYIKIIYEPAAPTLSFVQVDSLIQRAHFHGKKAVVHISSANDALEVVRLGADGLVHLWRDRQMSDTELQKIANAGVFVIPTMSVLEQAIDFIAEKGLNRKVLTKTAMLEEVRRLSEIQVPILTGTDPPNFGLDYGKSLHHELQLMQQAGIAVDQVIKSATMVPYREFGYEYHGIKEGKKASFFLINGDCEIDISNTENVLIRWVNGKEIEELKEF